jgi:hypothetical protein
MPRWPPARPFGRSHLAGTLDRISGQGRDLVIVSPRRAAASCARRGRAMCCRCPAALPATPRSSRPRALGSSTRPVCLRVGVRRVADPVRPNVSGLVRTRQSSGSAPWNAGAGCATQEGRRRRVGRHPHEPAGEGVLPVRRDTLREHLDANPDLQGHVSRRRVSLGALQAASTATRPTTALSSRLTRSPTSSTSTKRPPSRHRVHPPPPTRRRCGVSRAREVCHAHRRVLQRGASSCSVSQRFHWSLTSPRCNSVGYTSTSVRRCVFNIHRRRTSRSQRRGRHRLAPAPPCCRSGRATEQTRTMMPQRRRQDDPTPHRTRWTPFVPIILWVARLLVEMWRDCP